MPDTDHFNTDKALHVLVALLRQSPGRRMSILKAMKLVYIADRESLRETGYTITGDRFVAMDHGPVPSGTYRILRNDDFVSWTDNISRDGKHLILERDIEVDELSPYELELTNKIWRKYRRKSAWEMVDIAHEMREWQENRPPEGSSRPIPLASIASALNIDREAAEHNASTRKVRARLFGENRY